MTCLLWLFVLWKVLFIEVELSFLSVHPAPICILVVRTSGRVPVPSLGVVHSLVSPPLPRLIHSCVFGRHVHAPSPSFATVPVGGSSFEPRLSVRVCLGMVLCPHVTITSTRRPLCPTLDSPPPLIYSAQASATSP